MISCLKCAEVGTLMKAGFVRGKQRYFCRACEYYFTLPILNKIPDSRKHHQTTIVDIARELGVSNSTVSRALHDHPDINPDTKKAILEKALELDYQPNQLAQNLVKSHTHTIGIVVPEFHTPFFPGVIVGAQRVLQKAGYNLMIMQSGESYETEVANTKVLLANRVDGLLVSMSHETNNYDHFRTFEKREIPVVYFNRVVEGLGTHKVVADDYQGAFAAVEHLIQNGYRRIAHLGGPPNLLISQERARGYREALKKHSFPVVPELMINSDFTAQKAAIYARHLLDLPEPPDAIFAVNDPTAIEVLILANSKGIRVPEELGVVGFSDDPISAHIGSGLTTMKQPTAQIGEAAATMFLGILSGKEEARSVKTIVLDTQLVVRGSSVLNGIQSGEPQ